MPITPCFAFDRSAPVKAPRTRGRSCRLTALSSAFLGLMVLGALVGCGDGQAQAKQDFDEAMAGLDDVELGYVPASAKDYDAAKAKRGDVPLNKQVKRSAYRQKKFEDVIPKLESVAKHGESSLKASALRLLGQIEMSKARYAQAQASDAAAALTSRTGDLMSAAANVQQTGERGQAFTTNDSALLKQLDQKIATKQKAHDELQKQVQAKTKQRDREQAKAKKQKQIAKDKSAQAQKFSRQAFTSDGDESFGLRDKQAKAKRASNAAAYEAQRHQAKVDALNVDLAPIESQLTSLNKTLSMLKQKKKSTQQQINSNNKNRDLAQGDVDKASKQLLSKYQSLAEKFEQRVQGNYDRALKQIDAAIDDLDQANGASDGATRQMIQTDLLTARTQKVGLVSRYATALAGQHRVLQNVAKRLKTARALGEKSPIAQGLSQLEQRHQKLLDQSKQALKAARSLAKQFDGDNAQAWRSTLDGYASRLKALSSGQS